jgi:Holliday junction resolvase RusA-like endonuclease
MKIIIPVVGIPKGQPRARAFVRRGCNHAGIYNPTTADDWKACVYLAARQAMQEAGFSGWAKDVPLCVHRAYLFPRPKRLRDRTGVPHVGKPDMDNLDKATYDAMQNAGVFHNDSQVSDGSERKRYADPGVATGAIITIEELAE